MLLRHSIPKLQPIDDLVFNKASFRSPGFWEFLGCLNPLKLICDYIQQRHERIKDKQYRNQAEEDRLALQNALLNNQIVKERFELLKNAGVPDSEIRNFLLFYLTTPLKQLDHHIDTMLIVRAEVTENKKKRPNKPMQRRPRSDLK